MYHFMCCFTRLKTENEKWDKLLSFHQEQVAEKKRYNNTIFLHVLINIFFLP